MAKEAKEAKEAKAKSGGQRAKGGERAALGGVYRGPRSATPKAFGATTPENGGVFEVLSATRAQRARRRSRIGRIVGFRQVEDRFGNLD
jgi:hypothetical protein